MGNPIIKTILFKPPLTPDLKSGNGPFLHQPVNGFYTKRKITGNFLHRHHFWAGFHTLGLFAKKSKTAVSIGSIPYIMIEFPSNLNCYILYQPVKFWTRIRQNGLKLGILPHHYLLG